MTTSLSIRRIAAVWLWLPLCGHAADMAQDVFALVAPSVVTVQEFDAAGQRQGHGSGVVVAAGQVATNCHVVERAVTLRAVGQRQELAAQWTRRLPGLDLCLLSVPGLAAAPVPLRPSSTLVVGEPVYAVGNPLGFGLAVSSGLASMLQARAPYPMLVVTAPTSPGSSGGGLFDGQGRLVGLTTAIMGTGQNQSLVLVGEAVADLLTKGVERPPVPVVPQAERKWASEADLLHVAQDWARLEDLVGQWERSNARSAWTLVHQARLHAHKGEHAQAEAVARQALAQDGDLDMAWLELANALFAQDRMPEAIQALDQAERRDPMRGILQGTRSDWLRRAGELRQAGVQMREALRREPAEGGWWQMLGDLEHQLGRSAEASAAYVVAERLSSTPGGTGAPGAGQARILLMQGWNAFRTKRMAAAEAAFRKTLDMAPQESEAWNGLGAVLLQTGRAEEAEAAYTKGLATKPGDADLLANRGEAYRVMKRYEQAQPDALAGVRADPKSVAALRTLALVLTERGSHRDAGPIYARLAAERVLTSAELANWALALLVQGDVPGAMVHLRKAEADPQPDLNVFLVLARALAAQGDGTGTLAALERALALDPVNSVAWSAKGYALMLQGRLSEAVQALETAVRLDPALANGWINLGQAQMRAKNLGRAIDALEKGMALAPTALDARYYLGLSYLQARMPEKAREHAALLLAAQPSAAPAVEVMAASYLVEQRLEDAKAWYLKLLAMSPEAARKMRGQVIANGGVAALDWPN